MMILHPMVEPPRIVGHIEAHADRIAAIASRHVEGSAVPHEQRACAPADRRQFGAVHVDLGWRLVQTRAMTARNNCRCAIVRCEVGEHPHGVDHPGNVGQSYEIRRGIRMQRLVGRTGPRRF